MNDVLANEQLRGEYFGRVWIFVGEDGHLLRVDKAANHEKRAGNSCSQKECDDEITKVVAPPLILLQAACSLLSVFFFSVILFCLPYLFIIFPINFFYYFLPCEIGDIISNDDQMFLSYKNFMFASFL